MTVDAPSSVLIGDTFTFEVKFENTGAGPGYGPFVALCLPFLGADQDSDGERCDGIGFGSAEALFDNVNLALSPAGGTGVQVALPPDSTVSCPDTSALSELPLCGGTFPLPAGSPGCQLVVLELPFGSFFPEQPPIVIEITVSVDSWADEGAALPIWVQGGFRFGDDPEGTDCATGELAEAEVVPQLMTVTKTYLGPEGETATGPSFPRGFALTVDVAAGQTIDPLTLTDELPGDLVFQGLGDCPAAVVSAPAVGEPNGQLVLDFGTITGNPGPDAVCEVRFYVPDIAKEGSPVLTPASCREPVDNSAQAGGDWTPEDPRDPSPQTHPSAVPVTSPPGDSSLTAKCLAVQKGAPAVQEDTGHPGWTPGDVVRFSLDFQVSDYFQIGELTVTDLLSDGLELLPSPEPHLSVEDGRGVTQGALVPAEIDVTVRDSPCGDGATELEVRLSDALVRLAQAHPDGTLIGALAPGGGAPATGRVEYWARIIDRYRCPIDSDDGAVDKHDVLENEIVLRGEIWDPDTGQTAGLATEDDSASTVPLPGRPVVKEIYGRNDQPLSGPLPAFAPGDRVTFRLLYTLPATDAEALFLEDFLPDPAFDVSEFGTRPPPVLDACGPALPAAGSACFGPGDELGGFLAALPDDGVCPGYDSYARKESNSVCFYFGDIDDPANKPRVVELLFTLTVTERPFADGLLLTNELREHEQSSTGAIREQIVIEQLTLGQPVLRVVKGAVAACCPTDGDDCVETGAFEPPGVAPGPFGPPGSPCGDQFTPPLVSPGPLAGLGLAAGIEPGDRVRFAVVVENVGSSPNGAFDIRIQDHVPAGFKIPAGGSGLCVRNGAGDELTYSGDLFGGGILLDDESATEGSLSAGSPAPGDGTNLVVVTYDLEVTEDLPVGDCVKNLASVAAYAGSEGGDDHVEAGLGGPLEDTASLCRRPLARKSIVATSEAHTAVDPVDGREWVAIGEIVRYRLVVEAPRGIYPGFEIRDALPPGITFLADGTAKVALVSGGSAGLTAGSLTGPMLHVVGDESNVAGVVPGHAFAPTVEPVFAFGELRNVEQDCDKEFVVVEFNAQVANVPSNRQGRLLDNRFGVYADGEKIATSNTVRIEVVEPRLSFEKSVLEVADGFITFELRTTNLGDATAFEVRLDDNLPSPQLEPLLNTITWTVPPGSTVDDQSGGNGISVHVDVLDPSETVAVRYRARIGEGANCRTRNVARLFWTGLPGLFGTQGNPTGSDVTGQGGSESGERTFADANTGGVNDYFALTTTTPVPRPDLKVTKTQEGEITPLGIVTYTIVVSNLGPGNTSGSITLVDTLPPGAILLSADGVRWECEPPAAGKVACRYTRLPLLAGSSTAELTIVVQVPPDAEPGAEFVNCVNVATDCDDGPGPNSDCVGGTVPPGCQPQSATYTEEADFTEGVSATVGKPYMKNLHTEASDATSSTALPSGELVLDPTPLEPFGFVSVAKSVAVAPNDRGSVVRIDADTGAVLGEYFSAPKALSNTPSRTTVDQLGQTWVANRGESTKLGSEAMGSVVRIGSWVGGVVVKTDASAQYLGPPFDHLTCEDRHGATIHDPKDGLIKTSLGLGDRLPWDNAGGADTDGGVETAEDECITAFTRVKATEARTVAIDEHGDVWVGGINRVHEKLDGDDGESTGVVINRGCGGYGGFVDCEGVLWSARYSSSGATAPLRYDPATGQSQCLGATHGDYGLGLDPVTRVIWHSKLLGNRVCKLAPSGQLLGCFPHGNSMARAQGVAVDAEGNVWVAHAKGGNTTIGWVKTDGTQVGNVLLRDPSGHQGKGPTGVAVDHNGKIWVTNYDSIDVMRIDPDAPPAGTGTGFAPSGAVDLTVDLGDDANPYNYSDMTGIVAVNNPPQGFWQTIHDGGTDGAQWCRVCWNQESTGKGSEEIRIEVRVSDSLPHSGPWLEVDNCVELTELRGQYIEVRAKLIKADEGSISRCEAASQPPILTDLTLETCCCPDPADPGVEYVSTDPELCALIRLLCDPGQTPFSDECGCGCLGEPLECPPDSPRARAAGLFYPHTDCQAAIARAESPEALESFHYRSACERVSGVLPPAAVAAAAVSCTEADGGAYVEAEVCCPPPPHRDLSIDKRLEGDVLEIGEKATYSITVTNEGEVPVGGFRVIDDLPVDLTFEVVEGRGWRCAVEPDRPPQKVQCLWLGDALAPGASLELKMVVRVGLARGDTIENCVRVESGPDSEPDNDRSCVIAPVRLSAPGPDVTLVKEALPWDSGSTVHYRLTVRNHGAGPTLGGIGVRDDLPGELRFLRGAGAGSGWSGIDGAWECRQVATSQVDCVNSEPLPPTGETVIDLDFEVIDETAVEVGENCAEVSSFGDAEPGNDRACAPPLPPPGKVDLGVEKVAERELTLGGHGSFRFVVWNTGDVEFRGLVRLVEEVPPGVRFVSGRGERWRCDSGGVCRWNGPPVPPGESLPPLTVEVAVDPPETFPRGSDVVTNCGHIIASGDTNTENNRSCLESILHRSTSRGHGRTIVVAGIYVGDAGGYDVPTIEDRPGLVSFDPSEGLGVSVELEHRLSRRLGVELGVGWIRQDARWAARVIRSDGTLRLLEESRTTDVALARAGLRLHLTPERRTDLWLAAFVGYLDLGDVPSFETDAVPATGLALGFDRPLGSAGRWRLLGGLRYLEAEPDVRVHGAGAAPFETSVDYEPLMVELGIGYRF